MRVISSFGILPFQYMIHTFLAHEMLNPHLIRKFEYDFRGAL